jgi:hypothetical protein
VLGKRREKEVKTQKKNQKKCFWEGILHTSLLEIAL